MPVYIRKNTPIPTTVIPALHTSAHENKSASGRIFAFTFSGIALFLAGSAKHSSTFTGSETAANLNSGNAKTVTVKAKWKYVPQEWTFSYKNSSQSWTASQTGQYKLEVWGAQGGNSTNSTYTGGKGAYSRGQVQITSGTTLYIFVGQAGKIVSYAPTSGCQQTAEYGAYNGGGGLYSSSYSSSVGRPIICMCSEGGLGTGGGATDIRTVNSSYTADSSRYVYTTSSSSLSSRVLVASGGGGATGTSGSGAYSGKNGGYGAATTQYSLTGLVSNNIIYSGSISSGGTGFGSGDPVSGGFGYGGSGGNCAWAGGGSGYYGGGSGTGNYGPGAGGSSYAGGSIGGKTLSSISIIAGNDLMPSTSSGTEVGHSGNGYAKITFLGT